MCIRDRYGGLERYFGDSLIANTVKVMPEWIWPFSSSKELLVEWFLSQTLYYRECSATLSLFSMRIEQYFFRVRTVRSTQRSTYRIYLYSRLYTSRLLQQQSWSRYKANFWRPKMAWYNYSEVVLTQKWKKRGQAFRFFAHAVQIRGWNFKSKLAKSKLAKSKLSGASQ